MDAESGVVNSDGISELEARLKLLTEQISEGLKQLNQLSGLSKLDQLKHLQHLEDIEKLKSISESYLQAVNSTLKQVEGLGKLKDLNLLEMLSELNQLSHLDRLNKLDKLEELNKLHELVSLDRLHELRNLIFLEELKRLDKINELSKLEVIDRLDLTLNRHQETLRPLKHLDELENLNSLKELKSLSQLEALKNLSHLDKIALLENLNKLDNLKAMGSLDNLRHLSILDELKNLDELRKLQKLDDLDKLSELKNLDQLEKLNHLSKLDRIEDARFAERLNKLDKLDILKEESKKLVLQQILGTGLDVVKLSLAVVIIILILTSHTGQKVISNALPLIGFSNSAQTSLGLHMIMGQIPDEQFEKILENLKRKIGFEIDTLYGASPLPRPLERLALIKQLKAYDFSEFGSDLADDIKTKMDAKKNALNNQVIESLDFAIGIKKSEGNESAERLLRELKLLIMNGKFISALEISLPYWGSEKAITLAILLSIIEMEKESPELVENVLNRSLINKNL
jgi:hypothetical protein